MLNYLWLGMLLTGVVVAGLTGNMRAAVDGVVQSAGTAVTLAFGLIGVMALWLGVMRLAERSGLVLVIARSLRPVMRRLFPDVPPEHPAMASMMLNIAANVLGLTNAATPFGLRAMRDLDGLNPRPGTATNAMCTFLAINTGSVQLIPASAIAILASAGSRNPTAIVGSTLVATACSSIAALVAVKLLERLPGFRWEPIGPAGLATPSRTGQAESTRADDDTTQSSEGAGSGGSPAPISIAGRTVLAVCVLGFAAVVLAMAFPDLGGRIQDPFLAGRSAWVRVLDALSLAAIPFLLAFFPLYAALRGIPVYEEFVEGAREGFQIAVRIIPFLVAMLVAIGLLRGSGAIEGMTRFLRGPLNAVGFPVDLLPLALIRPLSGSASLAAFGDLAKASGPDSLVARMAGTLFGSTETTFYVVAVYFGAVAVRRVRHAVWAGLAADLTGAVAAVVVCRWMWGQT